METESAIYTLEIRLRDGRKVVKIGYSKDISERFKDSSLQPKTILRTNSHSKAKAFVANVRHDYKDVEVLPNYYPIEYTTLLDLRLINFENELKNA